MNVRIDDPRVDALAEELAKRTGEDPTAFVIRALEERLKVEQTQNRQSEDSKVAQLLAIAERATGIQGEGKTSRELVEALYDENGLPF